MSSRARTTSASSQSVARRADPLSVPPPHASGPSQTSRLGLAAFTTVAYLAALIALWGILTVAFDRDVVDYADAGPLLGPAMAASACVVTFVAVLGVYGATTPWPHVVSAAVTTAVVALLVGAIGYGITRSDLAWMPAAFVHFAIGPFVPAAAVLAAVAVAVSRAVTRRPDPGSSHGGII